MERKLPVAVKTGIKGRLFRLLMPLFIFVFLSGGCEKRELIEPTVGMDIAEHFWINVLLFDNIRQCSLTAENGFSVTDTAGRSTIVFGRPGPKDRPVKVHLQAGKIVIGERILGKEVIVRPENPFVMTTNQDRYRGNLKLKADSTGSGFMVVNMVPIEAYLAGVVGVEMPNYWEKEALKAQAIVARTYCLYIKNKFGINRSWDVRRTQASQMYKGLSAESATVYSAIHDTRGKVLTCKHSDGRERIFPTYYSSTCGGHTENSANVFGDSFEPLKGVKCPYCRMVTKPSFLFWPMVEFDIGQVSDRIIKRYPKLAKLKKIETIEPLKVSNHGGFSRIVSVKLTGQGGKTGVLRGEDMRLTIDSSGSRIKSTACQMMKIAGKFRFYAGRGYGHGVGMCQCGAEGMARRGSKSDEILGYYYPGSKIMTIY